ncbi:hypothetical protein [Roseateles aquatilis]|jgi:hypothetical protein|uniref:hypothetical protein n=1 Tax=Roseateles aquatilis TaxID=431061 RepID=UPI00187353DD|nr:hypothetical protein [Roseateles aquatilis]MBY0365421.1 hypothetical protein [Burkholderiaceae bacterium]
MFEATSAEDSPAAQDDAWRTILPADQTRHLRAVLLGRLVALCFGAGVDSTALLVALRAAGLRPDVITFADTGGEKPETLNHVQRINELLARWRWPLIHTCRKLTLPSTPYADLYGNCWANETLPSLAFGLKSCSIKWKTACQDQFLKGVARGPAARPPHALWLRAQAGGERIVKLIGYDCGKADMRRSQTTRGADADFDYLYPLQLIGWDRADCVRAIALALGAHMVPVKSACFFCPASKAWELWWLAAHHPDLLEQALRLEYRALTGRHSRFDEVEFGASWEALVRTADRFPSTTTTVGLGRSFAWNQWARVNGVTDELFQVRRDAASRARFLAVAEAMRDGGDNALDVRCASAAPDTGASLGREPVACDVRAVDLFAD